jgi:hypothetical protein
MIPLWKGKNPIYFGVIRSKVKVTSTINRISENRIVSTRGFFPFHRGIMWPRLAKIQYTELKVCETTLLSKIIFIVSDLDL